MYPSASDIEFGLKSFLELTHDEQMMRSHQLLAKEEINLMLYIYKKTFMLSEPNFLFKMKTSKFWEKFKQKEIWRTFNNDYT